MILCRRSNDTLPKALTKDCLNEMKKMPFGKISSKLSFLFPTFRYICVYKKLNYNTPCNKQPLPYRMPSRISPFCANAVITMWTRHGIFLYWNDTVLQYSYVRADLAKVCSSLPWLITMTSTRRDVLTRYSEALTSAAILPESRTSIWCCGWTSPEWCWQTT